MNTEITNIRMPKHLSEMDKMTKDFQAIFGKQENRKRRREKKQCYYTTGDSICKIFYSISEMEVITEGEISYIRVY